MLKKGYTLIEILVSLTIISLIFYFGFVNFRDFSRRQTLESEARMLKTKIRAVQQLSLSGERPSGITCRAPAVINGYLLKFYERYYEIKALCGENESLVERVDLSSGILLSSTSPTLLYKSVGDGTNLTSDLVLTLTQEQTGNRIFIVVEKTGEVR